MSALSRYGDVLRAPDVLRLTSSSVVARLPVGIASLAIVLFLREETGSYATAGVVAAAYSAGAGLTAPLRARQVDRHGPGRILPRLVAVYVVGIAGLVALALAGAPAVVLVALGLVAGSGTPPISSVLRVMWPALMGERDDLLPAAYALDAVSVELVFVSGPLIVAAVAAVASPQAALVLACGLVAAGTAVFLRPAPTRDWAAAEGPRGAGGLFGVLRAPGVLTVVLATIPLGMAFGTLEVALPAFAEDRGSRPLAGLLLAVWSLGSAAGGLWFGAQATERSMVSRYVRSAAGLPLALAPLAAAPSVWVMLVLLLPAGAFIAPTLSSGTQLIGSLAPAGSATEAYAWPTTAIIVGIGLGNAGGGLLVEALSTRAALGTGAAVAALGAGTILLRRGTLEVG